MACMCHFSISLWFCVATRRESQREHVTCPCHRAMARAMVVLAIPLMLTGSVCSDACVCTLACWTHHLSRGSRNAAQSNIIVGVPEFTQRVGGRIGAGICPVHVLPHAGG